MKSLTVLRLFSFLILDSTASTASTGARYTNSSGSIIADPSTAISADYIASGLGLVPDGSYSASSTAAFPGLTTATLPSVDQSSGQNSTNSADQCWAKWAHYWQLSAGLSSLFTTLTKHVTWYQHTYSYSVFPVTITETQGNGNFPTKTLETTFTTSSQVWRTIPDTNSTILFTKTTRATDAITLTRPPCSLPSYVPHCQSSWIAWGSSGARDYLGRPPCTQASIPKGLCETVMSNWLASERGEAGEVGGKIGLHRTLITVNGTTSMSSSWPTSSTLAPGCTVGCQSCRVSGSKVKLLYWPPETTSWRNGTFIATTGKATGVGTVKAYGTTMTSPTVYISFDKLHASNSCNVLGSPMSNIIVAVTNSATLSSYWGWGRYNGLQETASFNFTDLYIRPVPHSIYMSQPRCASSSNSIAYSCLRYGASGGPPGCSTENTPLLCATSLPYEPVISIPREVQQLQPEWDGCIGGIIGVYDPPTALQEAAAEAKPTIPVAEGSIAPGTTQPSETGPDATTAASPSPTASSVPPPTNAVTFSEVIATEPLSKDEPAPAGPTQIETEESATATALQSSPQASTESLQPGSLANTEPTQSNANELHNPDTTAEHSTTNALDVLTAAQTQAGSAETTSEQSDASGEYGAVSSPASEQDGGATEGGNDAPLFTFDPTTSKHQDPSPVPTVDSNPMNTNTKHAPSNDPTETTDNQPLFTFDPTNPAEQGAAQPPLATLTANDQTVTAVQSGENVVIIDASNAQILSPGQDTIIGSSQTLKLQTSHGLIVGDSTTISLSEARPLAPAAVWTATNGDTFSAIAQESNMIIAGAETTATLPNEATVLGDQTISPVVSNNGIVVDGSSIPVLSTTNAAVVYTAPNDAIISALPISTNAIVLAGQSSSITLSPGSATTFEGQTYSAASSGDAVVVDGSSTMRVGGNDMESTSLPAIAIGSSSKSMTQSETSPSSSTENDSATMSDASSPTSSTSSATARTSPYLWTSLLQIPLLFLVHR